MKKLLVILVVMSFICTGSAIAVPVITTQPQGVTVEAGETAVFTIEADDATGYSWKKLSDESEVGTEATLTINNVLKANEDVYYCVVSDAAEETVTSDRVNLMTERLVALWEFEDNLDAEDDEAATCWSGVYIDPAGPNEVPAVYVLDPCSIDGGKALQFAADALHVRITDSNDVFNFYPQGYTINVWVKNVQPRKTWGCFASKQYNEEEEESRGWVLSCNRKGLAAASLRDESDMFEDIFGTSEINDDKWHMVTSTYDKEAGIVTVYVDGKLENEKGPSSIVISTSNRPVVFGAETISGIVAYVGLLDKTSIYSYALGPIDVALLYTNVMTDKSVCIEQIEGDYNDNCRVDLQDFAILATNWLKCNLVPDCLP